MPVIADRLPQATQINSPNQDDRPGNEMSLIVIHGISLPRGQFGGNEIVSLLTNTLDTSAPEFGGLNGLRVSSHLLIRRDGELLQFVSFNKRAWHAGQSSFHGRENCNDFSIGIELEGTDQRAYEIEQYNVLKNVCAELMIAYGITEIKGHNHIAPGRKTDPGPAFDWMKLKRSLAATL